MRKEMLMDNFNVIKEKNLTKKDDLSTQYQVRALDQFENSILIPASLFKQESYLGKAYLTTDPVLQPQAGDWYYAGEEGSDINYPKFDVIASYGSKIIFSGLIWEVINELDIQAILDALNANISGLTYQSYSQYIEVGLSLVPMSFVWLVTGNHPSVNFTDSENIIPNTNVTGVNSFDVSGYQYLFTDFKTVTWKIISSTGKQSLVSTSWVFPTYHGVNTTGIAPTKEQILQGSKLLTNTKIKIDLNINTTATEYAWFALPKDQTAKIYESWYVNALNQGVIAQEGFLRYDSTIDVFGVDYDIYIYNYSSELNDTIKLT